MRWRHHIIAIKDKIPTMNIVDIAVLIIINAVWGLLFICPNICLQILMRNVDTTVDDRNHYLRRISGNIPASIRVD